jgi:hypothetical protein
VAPVRLAHRGLADEREAVVQAAFRLRDDSRQLTEGHALLRRGLLKDMHGIIDCAQRQPDEYASSNLLCDGSHLRWVTSARDITGRADRDGG